MKIRRATRNDTSQIIPLLDDVAKIHAKIRPDIFKNKTIEVITNSFIKYKEAYFMSLTIRKMQKYLKEKYKRTKPEDMKNTQRYFLKLIEEVGELAEAIRKDQKMIDNNIKGTIEEELTDVLYYVLMIANTYDIDLEDCFRMKEELNRIRYGHTLKIDDIQEDNVYELRK